MLARIFPMSKTQILLNYIGELKQDKARLEDENKRLKMELIMALKGRNISSYRANKPYNPMKLTPKEQKLYEYVKNNSTKNKQELAEKFNIKPNSVKIYLTRIRKKGFDLPPLNH